MRHFTDALFATNRVSQLQLRQIKMPRRYSRRRSYGPKDKYSIENRIVQTNTLPNWPAIAESGDFGAGKQIAYEIVPKTETQGMRKCKHFTMTFTCDSGGELKPMYYALVYVPDGYDVNRVGLPKYNTVSSHSPYEPNQFVISQGILDFSGGPLRIRSPLSRNLNSGDSIYLVFAYLTAWGTPDTYGITSTISYAISYQ